MFSGLFSGFKLYAGIAIVTLIISIGGLMYWMDSRITSLTEENAVLKQTVNEQNEIIDEIVDRTNEMIENINNLVEETAEIEERAIERNRRLNRIIQSAPSAEPSETEEDLNRNLRNLFDEIESITRGD